MASSERQDRDGAPETYVPALRFRGLTRFYDRLIDATLKEERIRGLLLEQAGIRPGHRVLDLGCGTGTFAVLVKQSIPKAAVFGVDGDAQVLALAREKARQRGVEVSLHEGMVYEPPFEEATFDRVTSTLVFHHLTTDQKRRTLARARALLMPGGEIHIADWGAPQNILMRLAFFLVQMLDGFATTSDSVKGILPALMREAGFSAVAETHREMTVFGTLALYQGRRLEADGGDS